MTDPEAITAEEAYQDLRRLLNGRRIECKALQSRCESAGDGYESQTWCERIDELEMAIEIIDRRLAARGNTK